MGTSNAQAYGMAGSVLAGGGVSDITIAAGGGKTSIQKAMNSVPQVNPAAMDALFQQGAAEQQQYYQQGLDYYADAVGQAAMQLQAGYSQGNSTLQPLSTAGYEAMNQQLRMMGMPAVSMTGSYANELNGIAGSASAQLQQQMNVAESLTDPVARAAARQQVLGGIQQLITANASPTAQAQISALGPRPVIVNTPPPRSPAGSVSGPSASGAQDQDIANNTALAQQQSAQQAYDSQVQQIQLQNMGSSQTVNSLQQLYNNYQANYSTDSQAGYTPAQTNAVLAATPGYQFALDSGAQAVARSGAASGMLQSGNTGAALQEFGQNLAQGTYNSYMANLQNISSQGSIATGQISANQVNQGQGLAALSTGLGAAVASTYQATGNAIASANDQEANLRNTDAMFNAQLQYDSKQANLNRGVSTTNAAISAAPGMMNANTQAAQFGYQTYAQQAAANAYSGGSLPTGAYSNPSSSQNSSGGMSI